MIFGLPVLCSGYSDIGYVAAASAHTATTAVLSAVDTAIMVAVALWQRNASESITNMQEDIANQQMILAEKLHAHAKLFWPEETRLVNDAFGEARAPTDYAGMAAGWQGFTATALSASRAAWLKDLERKCGTYDACEDARWQKNASMYEADTVSFAARQAEARAQTLRDRRYERQYYAIGLSQGVLQLTTSMQTAALSQLANAQGIMFSVINQARAGLGYWAENRQLREEGALNKAMKQENRWTGYQPSGVKQ